MRLKNKSVASLMLYIKEEGKSVVLFGAGVIGNTVVPSLFREYEIADRILFYVDNDTTKHGDRISVYGGEYVIRGPEAMRLIDIKNTVFIITNSYYGAVVEQFDTFQYLNELECYILPIIFVSQKERQKNANIVKASDKPLIPKVLHYIWFGNYELPKPLQKCIETWKEYCPDYEIICWNDKNYNYSKYPYMQQAYEAKKWAYVSDMARLDILYEYGGIYMDTDVYLVKTLNDFLYQSAFSSFEKWNVVNSGGCCGSVPRSEAIRTMLEFRKKHTFLLPDGRYNTTANCFYETQALMEYGLKPNGSQQQILDMTIYPSVFFHPYDYMSGLMQKTKHTFAIHCFNGGWLEGDMTEQRKQTQERYLQTLHRMEKE